MSESIFERRERIKSEGKLFKSLSGKEATALINNNPAEYQRLKASAKEVGLIGPDSGAPKANGIAVRHFVDVRSQVSVAEIRARLIWSEVECRKFYAQKKNDNPNYDLAKFKLEKPELYESLRLAAQSYSIIPQSDAQAIRQQKDRAEEPMTIIGDKLSSLSGGLDPQTPVSVAEFVNLIQFAEQMQAAK